MPENIFLTDSVPHAWLFPQMAAVVDHGRAGNKSAALTAANPTIIIPSDPDQPAWVKGFLSWGFGQNLFLKKLTAEKLVTAIAYALHHDVVANAAALGEKLRKENAVKNAVQIIKEFLEK